MKRNILWFLGVLLIIGTLTAVPAAVIYGMLWLIAYFGGTQAIKWIESYNTVIILLCILAGFLYAMWQVVYYRHRYITNAKSNENASNEADNSGDSAIPLRVKAWFMVTWMLVLSLGLLYTLLSIRGHLGSIYLITGVVLTISGIFTARKSRGGLIAAVVVYSFSSLLMVVVNPDVITSIGIFIITVLCLIPMVKGISVMKEIKEIEAAGHKVPIW